MSDDKEVFDVVALEDENESIGDEEIVSKDEMSSDKLNFLDIEDMDQYIQDARRKRSSSGFNFKLDVPERFKRKGFIYRWAKGTEQRVMQLKEKGWLPVIDKDLAKEKGSGDCTVKRIVGSFEDGKGRFDVLMCMPESLYKEFKDKELKRDVDSVEEQIKRGRYKNDVDEDSSYSDITWNGQRYKN